jgi:hypothetical protein
MVGQGSPAHSDSLNLGTEIALILGPALGTAFSLRLVGVGVGVGVRVHFLIRILRVAHAWTLAALPQALC